MIFQSTPSAWRETGAFPPFFWMEKVFQSTPSAWRETLFPEVRKGQCSHFNPLPPHGGRHHFRRSHVLTLSFQSTPSAWRETRPPSRSIFSDPVFQSTPSAWRETIENSSSYTSVFHFNPLPPHGGRHSKTAQESVFHFAYPCTILQKRMQKTTFCTRKNGFFRKKGEKFGAKPSASFCAPMIRTDTFPLNFSHRISGSSMSMVSFAPICSTFD